MAQNDVDSMREMMTHEGIFEDELGFFDSATWVLDEGGTKGFYTLRLESGVPYVVHFCIKQSERGHAIARRLVSALKKTITSFGFNKAIIGIPKDKTYLDRIASRYFRAVPYSEDEKDKFYLVEV